MPLEATPKKMGFSFMNRDKEEILSTIEEIAAFCETIERRKKQYKITLDSVESNSDHADLLLMPLCQIGESVQRSRDELEEFFPEVPWHQMAGLRNVIVHGYTKIDPSIVMSTVEKDIPKLREYCEKILEQDL